MPPPLHVYYMHGHIMQRILALLQDVKAVQACILQRCELLLVRIAFPQTNRMPKNQCLCWILSKPKTCRLHLHMVLVSVLEALVYISLATAVAQKENEMDRSMPAHLKHLFQSQMTRQHHFVLTKLERKDGSSCC